MLFWHLTFLLALLAIPTDGATDANKPQELEILLDITDAVGEPNTLFVPDLKSYLRRVQKLRYRPRWNGYTRPKPRPGTGFKPGRRPKMPQFLDKELNDLDYVKLTSQIFDF
ncbi:unnamed protein product [Leptosia nina]|uniref:Uncharacterized protein n=1 Tax=Leptosia nina TaxID=320188 RepID=A0AAV1JIK7_9NEOP